MRTTLLLVLTASAATLGAQQAPDIHLINLPSASSKPVLGNVTAVRQLPGGGVIVNDAQKRQLLKFDQALTSATVIADSVAGGVNAYGPSAGGLIPYFADSTLFIDPRDLSMFVLDPAGAVARVAAVPRSQDAGLIGSNTPASPGFDSKGRLVYRGAPPRLMPTFTNGVMTMPEMPDSSPIVRVDLATRKLDTAAFYKIAKVKMNVTQSEKGMSMTTEINPMPIVDDWAVLSDGTIAIVRGRDYHVDWVNAEGSTTASAKLPFEWQRLSDDDKIAVIDSAKTAMEKMRAAGPGGALGGPGNMMIGGGGGGGMVINSFSMGGDGGGRGGDGPRRAVEGVAGGGGGPGGPSMSPLAFVSPSDLPDYRPAFGAGAAKADLDGNLWIRTSSVRAGAVAGPIYDVVNGKGELTDRVQVPAGRQIVGFGRGGVVYMIARDDKGTWIEKTKRGAVMP